MCSVLQAVAMIMALLFALGGARAQAEDGGLQLLSTGDDSRGWEAVGRIDLGTRGFCTGTLIDPALVLTAAHCLFDRETGARIDAAEIRFLAGWRNGRAAAYRGVRRAIAHPDYIYSGRDRMDRVSDDLALLELDQPVRLPSIRPFPAGGHPAAGDEVAVVSYAHDRSEAPSLQRVCHVLGGQVGVVVLTCAVDFGSSGAPIFAFGPEGARVVSVVSAKAELAGRQVALGTILDAPLAALMAEVAREGVGLSVVASGLPRVNRLVPSAVGIAAGQGASRPGEAGPDAGDPAASGADGTAAPGAGGTAKPPGQPGRTTGATAGKSAGAGNGGAKFLRP